ncbi:MAG: PAS domain S-box protein [Balneolaceae bacterium]
MEFESNILTNTLDGFHLGILIIDPKGVVIYGNRKIETLLSLSNTQLVGQPFTSLPCTWFSKDGEEISVLSHPIQKALVESTAIQTAHLGLFNARTKTKLMVHVHVEAQYDEEGKCTHIVATFEEVESDVSANRNSAINDFNTILNLIPDSIGKIDAENKVIYFRSKRPERLAYSPEEMAGRHLQETLPANLYEQLEKKLNEARVSNKLVKFEYQYLLADNNIYWYETRLVPSDKGEVLVIIRDITDQKSITEDIKHEKNLFDTIITSLPGIFYLFNTDGKFLKWNENFAKVSGYSDEEIEQLHPLNFFVDDEKGLLAQKIANVFAEGNDNVEALFHLKNGTTIPYYFTGTALEYNGEPCLAGFGIDMSEEKVAVEQLKTSEYRFRAFIENGSAGITVLSPEMKIIYISPGIERILGYTEEEFIELDRVSIMHEDDIGEVEEAIERAFNNPGKPVDGYRCRYKHKNGEWRWLQTVMTNMLDDPAVGGIVDNFRDVTERVKAEKKLEQTLTELQTYLANTPLGYIVYDNKFEITQWSPRCVEMFGFTENDVLGIKSTELGFVYEDDNPIVMNVVNELMSGEVEGNVCKNRNYTKSGEVLDCIWYNAVMKNEKGEVVSIMSLVEDVTIQTKAEQAIKENEEMLSNLVSTLPGFVYRCKNDKHYTMLYMSDACKDITGYSASEFTGNSKLFFNDLYHPEDGAAVREKVDKAVKNKEHFELNYRIITKSGEIRWLWEKGYVVENINSGNEILGGFVQDITEDHLAQIELEKSSNEKTVLLAEIHHRVKNNLAIVSGLIQLQAYENKDENVKTLLLDSVGRIKSIALIHEHLYTSKDFTDIRFDYNIKKLVEGINDVMGLNNNVEVVYNLNAVTLDINQAVPCALLINEVITNTYKHAFTDGRQGVLTINCSEEENKVFLVISDNGVGIPEEKIKDVQSNSLGMKLLDVVTHQLSGTLAIDGSNGTTITVQFPKTST